MIVSRKRMAPLGVMTLSEPGIALTAPVSRLTREMTSMTDGEGRRGRERESGT